MARRPDARLIARPDGYHGPPLKLKYKLKRLNLHGPIYIMERGSRGHWKRYGKYASEDEAIDVLARLMGVEI